MEERVKYDEVIECDHSYDKTCFTSLSTVYQLQQVTIKQRLGFLSKKLLFRRKNARKIM